MVSMSVFGDDHDNVGDDDDGKDNNSHAFEE